MYDKVITLPYPEMLPSSFEHLSHSVCRVPNGVSINSANFLDCAVFGFGDVDDCARPVAPESGRAFGRHEEEYAEHDRYFRVERQSHSAFTCFLDGFLKCHVATYRNSLHMGVTVLSEHEWARLFVAMRDVLRLAGQAELADELYRTMTRDVPARALDSENDAAGRWLVGHQLFFVLIQGVILGLNCLGAALDVGAARQAERAAALAAACMRSSAVAMKFTSDFDPAEYESVIRPAMTPPSVRAGFSGLQTRDHSYLVKQFSRIRGNFQQLLETVTGFDDFTESVVDAYEAHEFVCARFGGDVLPSLKMAATAKGAVTTRAGVSVVREMMRSRLFALTGRRDVQRLRNLRDPGFSLTSRVIRQPGEDIR